MRTSPPSTITPTPSSGSRHAAVVCDIAPLLIGAALLATICRGHFIKPHGDFYEFRETGTALLHGEAPPSFKRAPVYPLLIAISGMLVSAVGQTATPADQLAAEWINAVLLPCNVLLCYVIGRRWLNGAARWVAVWTMLLPIGLYCTAHTLVEPLVVGAILTTMVLAQRGSRWAYLAASLATMTRYDAAGLIIGVAVADLLRKRTAGGVFWRTLLAFVPLAAWLLATALTWETRSQDHYLRQIAGAGDTDFVWPLATALRCVFGAASFATSVWFSEWGPRLCDALRWCVTAAALVGAVALLRRRDSGAAVGIAFFAGYVLVHAVFPFRGGFERFGYPLAPLVLLAAGVGLRLTVQRVSASTPSRRVRVFLIVTAVAFLGCIALGESVRLRETWQSLHAFNRNLALAALAAVALVWAGGWPDRVGVGGKCASGLAFVALALVQMRTAAPLLGEGNERINDVLAARWIRDMTPPDAGVLSASPGLLRLYCGDGPRGRFLGFGQIQADDWPGVLAECRRRGVKYIIWHDQVFNEQGAYYIHKWRLERYSVLGDPSHAPGVEIVKRFDDRPTLWILRILPAG